MKIYTKTGDEGKTSLFDNSRVWKSDERILSYGAVDELNSSIGVALSLELDPEIKDILIKIQNDLFIVGSDLANPKMSDKKIHFVSSDNKTAKEAKDNLVKRYNNYPASDADVIVALGGDGLMLQTLHDNINEAKPIFGINRGSVGFLMNDFSDEDLLERIASATLTKVHPLQMTVKTEKDEINAKAINEVSLLRQTYQAAKVKIRIDNKIRLEELICDGILLSTPAGSTAYNLSAHGPILPITSNLLALTPISAFRPRRWKGALLPHDSTVEIEVLEKAKRPVSAVADNLEIRDIENVKIIEDRETELFMLFDPETNLEEKILEEQFTYS